MGTSDQDGQRRAIRAAFLHHRAAEVLVAIAFTLVAAAFAFGYSPG